MAKGCGVGMQEGELRKGDLQRAPGTHCLEGAVGIDYGEAMGLAKGDHFGGGEGGRGVLGAY